LVPGISGSPRCKERRKRGRGEKGKRRGSANFFLIVYNGAAREGKKGKRKKKKRKPD